MRLTLLALAVWGCSSPADGPDDPHDPHDPLLTGDEVTVDEPTVPVSPEERLAQAESLLDEALLMVLDMEPDAVQRAYGDAMAMGDSSCPSEYTGYWFANCESPNGASFDGFAFEFNDDGSAGYGAYWYVYGEALIGMPSGEAVTIAGYAGWGNYYYAGLDIDYHYAYGSFFDETASGWMGGGHDLGLIVESGTDSSGSPHFAVDGTIGVLGGDPAQAVDFIGLFIDHPDYIYAQCDIASPAGAAWVRTADGAWIEIDFAGRCDGCADVYEGDAHLGELCIDSEPFVNGEVF